MELSYFAMLLATGASAPRTVFVDLLVSLSALLTHCTFFCPAVQYRLVAMSALVFPLAVAIYTASGLPFGLATAIYLH